MAKKDYSKLLWAPRFLAVSFVVLLVVVYLANLKDGASTTDKVADLLPAILTFVVIAATWKRASITGIYFLLFAVLFAIYFIFSKLGEPDAYSLMCGLPAIIGILFLMFAKKAPTKAVPAATAAPAQVEEPAEAPAEVPAEEPAE
jgi:hypothetical protein